MHLAPNQYKTFTQSIVYISNTPQSNVTSCRHKPITEQRKELHCERAWMRAKSFWNLRTSVRSVSSCTQPRPLLWMLMPLIFASPDHRKSLPQFWGNSESLFIKKGISTARAISGLTKDVKCKCNRMFPQINLKRHVLRKLVPTYNAFIIMTNNIRSINGLKLYAV